jgi:hypothetical protein
MKRAAAVVVLFAVVLSLASWVRTNPLASTYRDVLQGCVGRKCNLYTSDGPARLIFGGKEKENEYEIVRVGDDFVEIASKGDTRWLPLSRVETVIWK